jgi:hypothetical protein
LGLILVVVGLLAYRRIGVDSEGHGIWVKGCLPARMLFILEVAGQAAREIIISTKKVRTCFYIQ